MFLGQATQIARIRRFQLIVNNKPDIAVPALGNKIPVIKHHTVISTQLSRLGHGDHIVKIVASFDIRIK